jgi:hypothetical protein
LDEEGQLILIPEEILEVREKRLRKRSIKEYLVKWKNLPIEDATWEGEHVLQEAGQNCLWDSNF